MKVLITLLAILLLGVVLYVSAQMMNVQGERGDVNGDGTVNIMDVLQTVNIVLGIVSEPSDDEMWAADCNADGTVNIIDGLGIVNVILGTGTCISSCTELDCDDGDLCTYDSCDSALAQCLHVYFTDTTGVPDLDTWLDQNPQVRDAIVWETSEGVQSYSEWSSSQRTELHCAFNAAWNHESIQLIDPAPNSMDLADDENPTTVLAEVHAWPLYLAYVAHSLAVEMGGCVSWSVTEYSNEGLALLFDSREMFYWSSEHNGYKIDWEKGKVVPAPPDYTYTFLDTNAMIMNDRLHTIGHLFDWCRQYLSHYFYGGSAQNNENFWQYRGYPPVSRIIEGTLWSEYPEWGIRHWTMGCWGTTGFLRAVLRVVNIPVKPFRAHYHSTPHFITEDLYLSHSDDLTSCFAEATPPFPAEELFINQETFTAWFGDHIDPDSTKNNVGRRMKELAIEYLPDCLLEFHCRDISEGRLREEGLVFGSFGKVYSFAQLEEINFWDRIEEKIESFGGCDYVPCYKSSHFIWLDEPLGLQR